MKKQHSGSINWQEQRDIVLTILLWVILIGICFWAIGHVLGIIIIILMALIISYTLSSFVSYFEKFIPRSFAIALVYLLAAAFFALLIYVVLSTAVEQAASLVHKINNFLNSNRNFQFESYIENLSLIKQLPISSSQLREATQTITNNISSITQGVNGGSVVDFVSAFFDSAFNILVIIVLSIYVIADESKLKNLLIDNFPSRYKKDIDFVLNTLGGVIGKYLKGMFLLALFVGSMVGIGMWIFHVPYPLLLGVMAFVLEFIPIIGVFISGAVCVILALTQGVLIAALVIAYFAFVHVFEGDLVGPKIVGKAIGIHPAISLIAVFIGAKLFGMLGVLFAPPIAAIAQVFFIQFWERIKSGKKFNSY